MRKDKNSPILIAGAGICGLTTAIALRKKGFKVQIFERHENVLGEKGTALNIWSNAITALNCIGLGDAVTRKGNPITRQTVWSCNGDLLMDTPVGEISQEIGAPSVNIRRSDLIQILYEACTDIPIHFGVQCKDYDESDDGITLYLSNGENVHGQALIGADGIRSSIRTKLLADGNPSYLGYTIWRGISKARLNNEPGNLVLLWGPGINGGYWTVDDEHVSWTLGLKAPLGGKDEIGKVKSKLLNLVHDFPESFQKTIKLTPEEAIIRTDSYARENAEKWGHGLVFLAGDAAHASPTTYGQGGCQAIEDSIVLAENLDRESDIVVGLRRYEAQRKSRVDWVRSKTFFASNIQKNFSDPLSFYLKCLYVSNFIPKEENTKTWRRLLTYNS
jgi:FAD-dependent urate hydroxylase